MRRILVGLVVMSLLLMAQNTVTGILTIQVQGLDQALSERPTKAPGYAPGRTVVIDASGQLSAVSGALIDCVRVDGSSVPCSVVNFADGETPAGLLNGVNAIFTLAQAPTGLKLYRNGLRMKAGVDYILAGKTITFHLGQIPLAGDILLADYRF